jgi:hypothetical protein
LQVQRQAYADGPGTTTKFKDPESIAIDAAGNFTLGIVIIIKSEKITPNFVLTGNPAGKAGIHTVTLEANDGSGVLRSKLLRLR